MIELFHAAGFGCLVDVTLKLTPIHALIGPNDSGKSTILRALDRIASVCLKGPAGTYGDPNEAYGLAAQLHAGRFSIIQEGGSGKITEKFDATRTRRSSGSAIQRTKDRTKLRQALRKELAGSRLIRFDGDALRMERGLIPDEHLPSFFESRGQGLPGVYQSILSQGDATFQTISDDVRRLFPTVQTIRVPATKANTVVLETTLKNGTRVRADRMSEGLLYYLAYAALPYLDPVSLVLVEEPENGLHPARIAEVIRMLRNYGAATKTQIVMATHSPLVVNELQPEEVTVVTRPSAEAGTEVTPLTETPNFEKRSKVFELGELWLSYADGALETPLLTGDSQ